MAYTEHYNEILKQLAEIRQKTVENKEPENETQQYFERIKEAITKYQNMRVVALQAALTILEKASTSSTSAGLQENWEKILEETGNKSFEHFARLDDKKEKAFNKFALLLAKQEADFFKQLSRIDIAEILGQLMEETVHLRKEKSLLEGEWVAQNGMIKPEAEKMLQASKEMKQLFDKISLELASVKRRYTEWGISILKILETIKIPTPPDLPGIGSILDAIISLVATPQVIAEKYRAAYQKNERTLVMVTGTREMVKKYLDKTNLSLLKRLVEETKVKAGAIPDQTMKDGQLKDAKEFVANAGNAMEAAVKTYETEYTKFIGDYKGIFVGPIGTDVIEKLLKAYEVKNAVDIVENANMESALRDYYSRAEDVLNIPLGNISDAFKEYFKEKVRNELKKYKAEVDKTILNIRDALRIVRGGDVEKLREALNRSRGFDA